MDLDAARDVIRTQHRAVLATTRADGSTQMSPVTVDVDDDGYVVVSTRETAYKLKHILRNPSVAVCVLPDEFFGRWIQVEGTASVVHLPEAMEGLVEYYRRVSGEHPDWDDYRAAMVRDQRVLVRIALEKAGPDRNG
jgi:PPOX class probable F420-dependent enzyme